jgi:hypothetical protein
LGQCYSTKWLWLGYDLVVMVLPRRWPIEWPSKSPVVPLLAHGLPQARFRALHNPNLPEGYQALRTTTR